MPYNGSGSFTVNGSYFPAVSGALIESAKYNGALNDIATALSNAVTKDGQTTITGNLPMSGFRHTGVGDGATRTDYASVGQVQDGGSKWAGTAGGTANAITLTTTPAISAYVAGQSFSYKSGSSANTGAMTVSISGMATKAIQRSGVAMTVGGHAANSWFRITYDGAAFQIEQIGAAYGQLFAASAASNQSVSDGIATKVTLGTEVFDTAGTFASSRWTPNVAGYYLIAGLVNGQASNLTGVQAAIYKNGSSERVGYMGLSSAISTSIKTPVFAIVQANGTTDYFELYGIVSGSTLPVFAFVDASNASYFAGTMLRPI